MQEYASSKLHNLRESIKSTLVTFFINYENSNEKELKEATDSLEIALREKLNYYVKRPDEYDTKDIRAVLDELKDSGFLRKGLEDVNFRNKDFLMKRLPAMFKNLYNYMMILRNWEKTK